jgi:hypothetical protein
MLTVDGTLKKGFVGNCTGVVSEGVWLIPGQVEGLLRRGLAVLSG